MVALFPDLAPSSMLDRKFHYAQACARKIEEDLYFMTHSQLEYYHVIAVIIYKIKKEQSLPEQQPSTKEYLNVQQLINAMRCPNSTQKQEQVMNILKNTCQFSI